MDAICGKTDPSDVTRCCGRSPIIKRNDPYPKPHDGPCDYSIIDWKQRAEQAERERDAYKKAKEENDERFMIERDEARRERDAIIHTIQRYQPGGSPPGGDGQVLALWILGTLAKERDEARTRVARLETALVEAAKLACDLCRFGEPILGTVNGVAMHSYYCGGGHSGGKSCRHGNKPCKSQAIRSLSDYPQPDPLVALAEESTRAALEDK